MLTLDLRAVATTLARHPPENLTMAVVARELGVAKPTLYRMAGSKAALLEACLDAEAERLLGHLSEHVGDPRRAVELYAADSPGGFALLFERRPEGAHVRVRRVETQLASLRKCREIEAAELLGGATAVVSRLRAAD